MKVDKSKKCFDEPNNYIFKINRNSLAMEIISKDDIGYIARDLEVSPQYNKQKRF